jgi:hypothetical protein
MALQVINPAPLTSTNSAGNTVYSGPAYWPANGGQVFYRGRRTSTTGATLFRRALPPSILHLEQSLQPASTAARHPNCKCVGNPVHEALCSWETSKMCMLDMRLVLTDCMCTHLHCGYWCLV